MRGEIFIKMGVRWLRPKIALGTANLYHQGDFVLFGWAFLVIGTELADIHNQIQQRQDTEELE